jgi:hypothetical protein
MEWIAKTVMITRGSEELDESNDHDEWRNPDRPPRSGLVQR